MFFLYISSIYLSVSERNTDYDECIFAKDTYLPLSINKFFYIYEIDSVETCCNRNIGSLENLENDELESFKNDIKNEDKEMKKITLNYKILNVSGKFDINEEKKARIYIFLKDINEIISDLHDIYSTHVYKNNKNYVRLYKAFSINSIVHLNATKSTTENSKKFQISIEEFSSNYSKIYKCFLNDLVFLKHNNIENVRMKKTLANILALMMKSTDTLGIKKSKDPLNYIINNKFMSNNSKQMSFIALCNLYLFALKYDEIKLI